MALQTSALPGDEIRDMKLAAGGRKRHPFKTVKPK